MGLPYLEGGMGLWDCSIPGGAQGGLGLPDPEGGSRGLWDYPIPSLSWMPGQTNPAVPVLHWDYSIPTTLGLPIPTPRRMTGLPVPNITKLIMILLNPKQNSHGTTQSHNHQTDYDTTQSQT